VITGAGSQLSVAVAVPVLDGKNEALQLIVMSAGHILITGGVLSCTVTLNVQVEILPWVSLNVYVTAVVPTGKVAPGEWLLVVYVIDPRQLSSAVGSVHVAVWLQVSRPAPV